MILLSDTIRGEKPKVRYFFRHYFILIFSFIVLYALAYHKSRTENSEFISFLDSVFPVTPYFEIETGYSTFLFAYMLYWILWVWHIYVVVKMYMSADSTELSRAASHKSGMRTFSISFFSIAGLVYIIRQFLPDIQPPNDGPEKITQLLATAFVAGTGTTIDLFLICRERLREWRGAQGFEDSD